MYALRVLPHAWVLLRLLYTVCDALRVLSHYTVCYALWVLPPLYTVRYICTAGTATSVGIAAALY